MLGTVTGLFLVSFLPLLWQWESNLGGQKVALFSKDAKMLEV